MTAPASQADPAERRIAAGAPRFAVVGNNRALLNAVRWLAHFGAALVGATTVAAARALEPRPLAILIAGDTAAPETAEPPRDAPTEFRLWDYEVGRPGSGDLACAVSGVSTVIGTADGPPGVLPAHIAEKWAGLFGASLALSLQFAAANAGALRPQRVDVSAADALRAFAEQNSGNHAGVPYGWRRNGRVAVEHGGVFPQGFFRCRNGHIAVQARSRQDWSAILAALDEPEWSRDPVFRNPFKLSEDDRAVMPLLEGELMRRDRRELLDRALAAGAPMAPVLTLAEAQAWTLFRPGFIDAEGRPRAPWTVRRRA